MGCCCTKRHMLKVHVVGATELPNSMQSHHHSMRAIIYFTMFICTVDLRPTVDPYVQIIYRGTTKKTNYQKNVNEAQFNETLVWEGADKGAVMTVQVYDWDTISRNDIIGSVRVPTNVFEYNETQELDLELIGKKEQGRVQINVRFMHIPSGDVDWSTVDDPEKVPFNQED
eukprot:153713_1